MPIEIYLYLRNCVKSLYYIALVAPDDIDAEVLALKNELARAYGARAALKSPAHITMVPPFRMDERDEQLLVGTLRRFASEQSSFSIVLDGFGHFGRSTIFVKVVPSPVLDALHRSVLDTIRHAGLPITENSDMHTFHPHVTLATRDLEKRSFDDAWSRLTSRTFTGSWLCTAIALLKHNGTRWDVNNQCPFR